MKYRKKPIIVSAFQMDKDTYEHLINGYLSSKLPCWFKIAWGKPVKETNSVTYWEEEHRLTVETLEGELLISVDDFVIKGIKGELYPCKPDIFKKSYEKVDDKA